MLFNMHIANNTVAFIRYICPVNTSREYMCKSIASGTFPSLSSPQHYHMPSYHISRKPYFFPSLPLQWINLSGAGSQCSLFPLLLINALRRLLKREQEIRRVGGMRYHKLNWDLICDGISKRAGWRGAGNTLGGMSSPSGQTIALRLCKQFLITSLWLTGDFDPRPRHKQATGVCRAFATKTRTYSLFSTLQLILLQHKLTLQWSI